MQKIKWVGDSESSSLIRGCAKIETIKQPRPTIMFQYFVNGFFALFVLFLMFAPVIFSGGPPDHRGRV